MMRIRNFLLLLAALSGLVLSGCGDLGDDSARASGPSSSQLASAATVGADICVTCHTSTTPVKAGEWLGGVHANNNSATEGPDLGYSANPDPANNCIPCHNPLADGARLAANVAGQVNRPVVGCETCHGGGELHLGNWSIAYPRSSRDKCIVCHPLTTDAAHGAFPATISDNYSINDTHVDDPATGFMSSSKNDGVLDTNVQIEGYVVKGTQSGCSDCHNAHTADVTVNRQWARSAHGGHILAAKENGDPGVTDASGVAWTHYNWDDAGRAPCQRCHTATGAANFLNDPVNYVAANNDFSHLDGWAGAKTSPQNEMLYCWACHTDASSGALRNPGALSFTGSLAYTNGATAVFPDIRGSNICLACHAGRASGDSIKLDTDADGVRSFINSHYLAAGGTIFTTTGYEFDGLDYTDIPYYKHKFIGVSEVGTGNNGPCVGCHMSRVEKHLFMPVEKDAAGVITSVETTVCATCHWGYDLVPVLNTAKNGYENALELLMSKLDAKKIYFYPASPYFYKDSNNNGIFDLGEDLNRNGVLDPGEDVNSNTILDKGVDYDVTSGTTSDAYTDWASVYGLAKWKETMGASFNLNLLVHDPGGYTHNRIYAKRLIFDSIDFIDNGTLDGNITVDETLYPEAAVWFAADAATNLAERP